MFRLPAASAWVAALVFFSVYALASRTRDDFRAIPADHYVVAPTPDVRIDWTAGAVYARARVRLPRIAYANAGGFADGAPRATSLTEARTMAREAAREQAGLQMMNALGRLPLDSRGFLADRMADDRELRDRLGELAERFVVRTRSTGEGYETVELAMSFTGERGLYALLLRSLYASEPAPETDVRGQVDAVSGLIIDVSELSEFQPSLEPRVYSDRGRLIYGPEIASRSCSVRRGLAVYHSSLERARQDRRAGANAYYVYAGGVTGANRSDIYLDAEDVERILGHESGRTALRRCAVTFVMRRG
jgi:hypothetical protein